MERPAAIEWIRKLRRLGQGDSPEAATARARAADYQAKHKISEAEIVAAENVQTERESSGTSGFSSGTGDENMEFLRDFVTHTRATLCSEGRKRGRWADTPHGQRILRHRANAAKGAGQ